MLTTGRLEGASRAPRLSVALARLVDLKAALLAEARARGPDGPRVRVPQPARARATSSVDGWVSMALRLDVLEAAGARSSERRRAWESQRGRRDSRAPATPPV